MRAAKVLDEARLCEDTPCVQDPLFDHPWMRIVEPGLYHCLFPPIATEQESQVAIELAENFYRNCPEPFSWIMDSSQALLIKSDARGRKLWADHLNRMRPHFGEYCTGVAMVLPNRVMRLTVKAITWIAPFNFESLITDGYQPAEDWLRERLVK